MVKVTNVSAVKANMVIAIVTMKIDALPDHPVPLAPPVPMENTAQKERKAKLDQLVPVKDTNIRPDLLVVKNAPMDPKDPTVLLDPLERLVAKANLVPKEEMENPAAMVPARLEQQEHPEPMENLVPKVITAPMPKVEAKVLPVEKVKTVVPVRLVAKETMELQAKPVQPALLVHPEVLAKVAKMEEKDPLAHLVHPAVPARMPNTVLAPIVPRKHYKQQHRINPNTILGQSEFDNDNQFFQHNLKLLVSIIIFCFL